MTNSVADVAMSTDSPPDGQFSSVMDQILERDSGGLLSVAPKSPSNCPLFCCFYSEFDIKKGPTLCFQSPKGFMDLDINVSTETIQDVLAQTFEELCRDQSATTSASGNHFTNQSAESKKKEQVSRVDESNISSAHSKSSPLDGSTDASSQQPAHLPMPPEYHPPPNPAVPASSLSIFDSTSEYIITGSELTSKIITLSTHSWHIMTRPTMIVDERYERNSHLFSVGIVLRRAADSSPFRPLISKLALTLEAMEKESMFLTNPKSRGRIQTLLERVLLSLNSSQWECNLLLSKSNALHLKLYRQPKPEASPVHDHEVPVLLRRDMQLQMYDWDLAINWVIMHIDGVTNARQISVSAEVDLEMVRACLRVLKHHGVIALVSPFSYTNRYEFTAKATAMLAGKEPRLLHQAMEFALKLGGSGVGGVAGGAMTAGGLHTAATHPSGSAIAYNSTGGVVVVGGPGMGSGSPISSPFNAYGPSSHLSVTPSSSYPPRTMGILSGSHRSNTFRNAMMGNHSLEKESSIGSGASRGGATSAAVRGDQRLLKSAICELYCACNRSVSFGDLWVSLTSDVPIGLVVPNLSTMPSHGKNSSQASNLGGRYGNANSRQRRQSSITDDHGEATESSSLGLSPSGGMHMENTRRPSSKLAHAGGATSESPTIIDWNDFFKRIDHRRFFTFGLIHGLVTRVHNYPCYPYSSLDSPNMDTKGSVNSNFPSNLKGTALFPSPTTLLDSAGGTDGYNSNSNASPSKHSQKSSVGGGVGGVGLEQRHRQHQLAQDVIAMMDGTRCDDELACMFSLPIGKLIETVETFSKHKVLSMYSERANDC